VGSNRQILKDLAQFLSEPICVGLLLKRITTVDTHFHASGWKRGGAPVEREAVEKARAILEQNSLMRF